LRRDRKRLFSWRNFFIVLDRMMHWAEAVHLRPVRAVAMRKAEKWLLERLEMSNGLGAIYPAMLNAIIALRCLGYSEDDPQVIRARDEFEKLGIEQPHSGCSHAPRLSGIRRKRFLFWERRACRATIRA
jgi:squalene-hopene/tetraprenyl-beta-curcumene cyclase